MNLVSIIVPVYNTSKYLNACVDSILRQTYANFELLLIDDGSTDESFEICESYSRTDARVKVYRQSNAGVSSARNHGLSKANGLYVMFVDSDDSLDCEALNLLVQSIMENRSDVATCGLYKYVEGSTPRDVSGKNSSYTISGEDAARNMLYQRDIVNMPGAKIYRYDLIEDIRFAENIAVGEDLDFNFRALSKAKYVTINSARKYFYQQRVGSAMRSSFSEKHLDAQRALASLVTSSGLDRSSLTALKYRQFMEATYVATSIPWKSKRFSVDLKDSLKLIRQSGLSVITDKNVRLKYRFYAIISLISPSALVAMFKIKKKLVNEN